MLAPPTNISMNTKLVFFSWLITIYSNLLQVRAKNQLRVNGLGFYLYFGSFFTVGLTMMFILCAALLILAYVSNSL